MQRSYESCASEVLANTLAEKASHPWRNGARTLHFALHLHPVGLHMTVEGKVDDRTTFRIAFHDSTPANSSDA